MPSIVMLYLQSLALELIDEVDGSRARDKLWANMTPGEQKQTHDVARAVFGKWVSED